MTTTTTTNASCLRNPHDAEILINLQAGFPPNFAPRMSTKSRLGDSLDIVDLLPVSTKTSFSNTTVWRNNLILAITYRLFDEA